MYLSKILKVTATFAFAATVLQTVAGGSHVHSPSYRTYSGTYLEGNVGYASRDWGPSVAPADPSNFTWSNKDGGTVGGIDIGQQFNRYVALEAGWEYLPKVKATLLGNLTDEVNSWLAYLAPKLLLPIHKELYVFVKGGITYVYNKNHPPIAVNTQFGATKNNYWTGIVALGAQYYYTPRVSLSFQAAYVPGCNAGADRFRVPATYYYVGMLGYKFML